MLNKDDFIPLEKICIKIGSGSTPRGGRDSYKVSGISLIRSLNVHDFNFKYQNLAFIDEDQALKLKNVTIEKDDILLNITGASVARCCMVPEEVIPARVNQHVAIIRINKKKANPKYVLFVINSNSFKKGLLNLAETGATREALTKTDISNYKIPLPNLAIQNRIAEILDNYGILIKNNIKRISKLEKLSEQLYKEWFVRMRFPNYENTKFVKGIPEGWEIETLDSVSKILKGKNITKETVEEGFVPVVAGGLSPAYYHNKSNTKAPTITISASGANAGFVNLYFEDIWASDCSFIDTRASNYLYFSYLTLKVRQQEIYHLQRGSAQPHVYPKDIKRVGLFLPPENLLKNFEKLMIPVFEEIQNLKFQVQNLKKTRDLLLPRLISGKLKIE